MAMTYLIPQRASYQGSNAAGVHQLTAQGCARQRATLGKGRVNTCNPEGVAEGSANRFELGFTNMNRSEPDLFATLSGLGSVLS